MRSDKKINMEDLDSIPFLQIKEQTLAGHTVPVVVVVVLVIDCPSLNISKVTVVPVIYFMKDILSNSYINVITSSPFFRRATRTFFISWLQRVRQKR